MSIDDFLDLFDDQQKAIDHAMWLNFKYRIAGIVFGVIPGRKNDWAVCEEAVAKEIELSFFDLLPKDYSTMSYKHLDDIRRDKEPLPHWESIIGMVSVTDGEILRYILKNKIPLDKIIRHELALRGYDENHRWCGFDKAREIWLTGEN
jgi:hypothetical protein